MILSIIKNYKKSFKYLYNNFVPEHIKVKLSNLLDPLPKNRLRADANIRTENYYQACKKELNNNDNYSKNNYFLHRAFKRHLVRSNLVDDNWWSDFIILINLPEGQKFQEINQSLIDRIAHSNFDSLYYFEVLDIYALCLRLSLFELGYHLREKSLRIALEYPFSSKKNESWKLKAKLSALLETGNFYEFDQLFPFFKSRRNHDKYSLAFLRELLENCKNQSVRSLPVNINSEQDLKFQKFVENKKIVVVSPKPVNTKDGYKIDNADIVIRINHTRDGSVNKGFRCDINYLNFITSRYIQEKGVQKWPSDTKWIIGRSWGYLKTILKKLSSDEINIKRVNHRIFKKINNALFYGSLFGLPDIIVDLVKYNPKEIFLYHFDLQLTINRTPGYFAEINNNEELRLKILKSFPKHDPIINFIILKSFWKQGFIKGDYHFEEVIKLNTEDYIKNLQKSYHNGNSFDNN